MAMYDEVLEQLLEGTGWSTDGFGIDSNLVCDKDGTMIEQDAAKCPVCERTNPLILKGVI